MLGIVIVLLTLSGCDTARTAQDNPQNVIWESWEIINELHVDSNNLDKDRILGGAINAMLSVALEPSYPFLKGLGSSNEIPPANIPKDLKDLRQSYAKQSRPPREQSLRRRRFRSASVVGRSVPRAAHSSGPAAIPYVPISRASSIISCLSKPRSGRRIRKSLASSTAPRFPSVWLLT